SYGVDLGIMGRIPQLRMGLVARNVNRPTFSVDKNSGLKHFAIDPQMRAGVAYVPCGWFTLAVDMDVTRNRSAYDGYYSRLLSAGMELKAFNFLMFRLGGYSNIGDNTKHDQLVLTAGVGVNLWLVRADIGAAMSPDTQRIGGSTVPSEARGQASLSIQF
ncbi:MAG: conjugal transfer protein TraF, partial [bacterium]